MNELCEPQTTTPAATPEAARRHQLLLVRHLAAVMMLGQMNNDHEPAQVIYETLTAIVGNGRSLRVSMALAAAFGGNTEPSRALLAEGARDWPDAEPTMVAIALALKIGGEADWASIIDEMLSVSIDETTRSFARQVQRLDLGPSRPWGRA